MRVAIMQPTYLPWMGYFDLMLRSDVFVFLDDVAVERKSFQTRQRIKGPNGPIWLSIPCKHGPQDQRICDVEIDNSRPWSSKHWWSIRESYAKAPHLEYLNHLLPGFDMAGEVVPLLLSNFTVAVIMAMATQLLDWNGLFSLSSKMSNLRPDREDHIIDICKAVGVDELYDAAGAEALLDPVPFKEAGIRLVFQKYEHPVYRQLHGPFVPYLSALDAILNCGSKARNVILSGGKSCES